MPRESLVVAQAVCFAYTSVTISRPSYINSKDVSNTIGSIPAVSSKFLFQNLCGTRTPDIFFFFYSKGHSNIISRNIPPRLACAAADMLSPSAAQDLGVFHILKKKHLKTTLLSVKSRAKKKSWFRTRDKYVKLVLIAKVQQLLRLWLRLCFILLTRKAMTSIKVEKRKETGSNISQWFVVVSHQEHIRRGRRRVRSFKSLQSILHADDDDVLRCCKSFLQKTFHLARNPLGGGGQLGVVSVSFLSFLALSPYYHYGPKNNECQMTFYMTIARNSCRATSIKFLIASDSSPLRLLLRWEAILDDAN